MNFLFYFVFNLKECYKQIHSFSVFLKHFPREIISNNNNTYIHTCSKIVFFFKLYLLRNRIES